MSSILRGAYALTLAAAVAGGASAQQAGSSGFGRAVYASDAQKASDSDGVDLASCEVCDSGASYGYDHGPIGYDAMGGGCGPMGCDTGGCDSMGCGPTGCGSLGGGSVCQRKRLFVGGEYLSVRANYSEATAYRSANIVDNSETFEQFDFDYGDSYRLYAGYRLCECDAEIRFTYTNFQSDGGFGPVVEPGFTQGQTTFTTIASPFEVLPAGPGDTLAGSASVEIDNYDLGFAKSIPLGSPMCGGCGDCCGSCDPCGDCWCPAWDIQWTGGIRVANVDSNLSWASNIQTANGGPSNNRSARSIVNFDGVGLRSGLIGRRYIGKSGFASVFIRGDISLLLGDVDMEVQTTGGAARQPRQRTTEVIPVTELEGGGTIYLTRNLQLSGGYLLSAWHDLGHRFEYDYSVDATNNLVSGTAILSSDDANMLMFDGWFLRLEAFF